MRTTVPLAALAVLAALAAGSCTRKTADEKVLNVSILQKVKGMDPIHTNDLYSAVEVARVYEGLLEYDYLKRPYELAPNLAESLPEVSDDGLTYTFRIRKGVLFHDDPAFPGGKGRELTARDVVYSVKRLADVRLQGLGWWLLDGKIKGLNEWREKHKDAARGSGYDEPVEGLAAVDDHTVRVVLTRPSPQVIYAFAMPFTYVVAREAVERYGEEFLNHPVGTGPFVLDRFAQTNRITYERNPNFREKTFPCEAPPEHKAVADEYCGKRVPFVDKVVVEVVVEDQPRWLNFQRGNLDYVAVPKDRFDSVIVGARDLVPGYREKGMELLVAPSLDITYHGFNHDLELLGGGGTPAGRARATKLRQAMMLAFDVQRANRLFYNNTALPAQSIVPPGIKGHVAGFGSPWRHAGAASVEAAKRLLAEAGYPGGRGLPELALDIPASTTSRQMAEYFRGAMDAIGVKVRVNQNTWPEFQKKITNRQIELYAIAWGADYPDAENFLQLLYGPNRSPGANGSGYDDPEFNDLYRRASVMRDVPERTALYERMYRMAAERVPLLFGFHRQAYVIKHAWVKNFVITDFEMGMGQYIDIDLAKKREIMPKL